MELSSNSPTLSVYVKKLFKNFTKEFLLGILWIFFVYFEWFFSHNGVSIAPF